MYKVIAFKDNGFPVGTTIDDVLIKYRRLLSYSGVSDISYIDDKAIEALQKMLIEKLNREGIKPEITLVMLKELTLGELITYWEEKDTSVARECISFRGGKENSAYPLNVIRFSELLPEDQLAVFHRLALKKSIKEKYERALRDSSLTRDEIRKLQGEKAEVERRFNFMKTSALEIINSIDKAKRSELIGFLSHFEPKRYIGSSIIKGYFFLSRGLKARGVDPSMLLSDIVFTNNEGTRKFLFRSTICEMFGQFVKSEIVAIDKHTFSDVEISRNESKAIRNALRKKGVLNDEYKVNSEIDFNSQIDLKKIQDALTFPFLNDRQKVAIIKTLQEYQDVSFKNEIGLEATLDKIAGESNKNRMDSTSSNVLKGIIGELLLAYFLSVIGFEIKQINYIYSESGREVDLYAMKDGVLYSIEVKNWEVKTLEVAKELFERIKEQFERPARVEVDERMAQKFKADDCKRVAFILRHTKYAEQIIEWGKSVGIAIKFTPLVPDFLVKRLSIPNN